LRNIKYLNRKSTRIYSNTDLSPAFSVIQGDILVTQPTPAMLNIIDILYILIVCVSYPVGLLSVGIALFLSPDLLQYGKTLSNHKTSSSYANIFNQIYKLQVKRSWFIHFYYLSCVFSCFNTIYEYTHYDSINISFLYLIHSTRRLLETYKQNSTVHEDTYMNISHYLVGIWFYFNFNFLQLYKQAVNPNENISSLQLLIFLTLNALQCIHHLHIQSLKKYTIPYLYLFKRSYCAHYFIEILIYLSLMWFDHFIGLLECGVTRRKVF